MFRKKLKTAENGQKIRPAKGKCPVCKAKQNEYCKDDCTLLDPCHMAIE